MESSRDAVDERELGLALLQQRPQAVVLVEADAHLLHTNENVSLEEEVFCKAPIC